MTDLRTFHLPTSIVGTTDDVELARQIIEAWRTDGIFQVATTPLQGFAPRAVSASSMCSSAAASGAAFNSASAAFLSGSMSFRDDGMEDF